MAATPDGGEDPAWDEHTQVGGSQLLSQEGIYQLTQDLRSFSEGLTNLKAVFSDERGINVLNDLDVRVRVVAHQRLGELLRVLKYVINKYSELNSSAILSAAEGLINQVKNFNYENAEDNVSPEIFAAINNLALAFSSSVSECLVGDMNISPTRSVISAQSLENINNTQKSSAYDPELPSDLNEQEIDGISTQEPSTSLPHDSLDICFERSKAWSKYANDLLNYVKKKAHIENEYAKNLSKLSQQTRTILSEQSFLPFQSLYCTAIDQDREFASNSVTTYQNLIMAHKFIEPLQAKRMEHDRRHKLLREQWRKDKRWLDDAEANLKKAKQQYQARNQEYQKAKEAAIRVESEQNTQTLATEAAHSRQSSSGAGGSGTLFASVPTASLTFPSSKMERKKKQEEDTYFKASQAEHYYRACVNEANTRRKEVEKREEEYLQTLKDLMLQCEQTMKSVTIGYFSLHHQLYSPLPIQYQALQDDSKSYEPGFQYAEYLRNLMPANDARHDYKFEPYHLDGQMYFDNPNATTNLQLPSSQAGDASPLTTRHTRGISDTESSSSRSLDDLSPAASPSDTVNRKKHRRRDSNEGSISSNELLEDKDEAPSQNQAASPESSPVPTQKLPKTLKNTIFNLRAFKGRRSQKQSMFGVDFINVANESPDGIPFIIKKCISEIDNRALTSKGIYRVNGVKLRVEKLCSMMDSPNGDKTDLSEYSPRDISGVLKYFLRQLPEPLLMFRLYKEFLDIARQYQLLMKASPEAQTEESPANEEFDDDGRVNSRVYEENSIKFNMILTAMHACVNKLPEPNRNTLQYIVAHLSRIAAHSDENKMPASNLAIVFGPNLLRPAELIGNELQALMDLPAQSQVINMLILHRDIIFDTYSHQAHNELRTMSPVENQATPTNEPSVKDEAEPPPATKLRGAPDSSSSTLSSRSSDVPTTTDQVLLNIDDTSLSNTRSSSTDDLLTPPTEDAAVTLPIHRSAYRDQNESSNNNNSSLNNSSTNGERMKVTNTGEREIVPDSTGVVTPTNEDDNTLIEIKPLDPQPNKIKETPSTNTETKPSSNEEEPAKETPQIIVENTDTVPDIPVRKYKRRSGKEDRSRKISAPAAPLTLKDDELQMPPSFVSKVRHSFAAQTRPDPDRIVKKPTSVDDFSIKRKETTGRQLPLVPASQRRIISQPISMPGRTPPHHSKQLHTWSFPDDLQNKTQGQKRNASKKKESVVIRKQEDEEVSFC